MLALLALGICGVGGWLVYRRLATSAIEPSPVADPCSTPMPTTATLPVLAEPQWVLWGIPTDYGFNDIAMVGPDEGWAIGQGGWTVGGISATWYYSDGAWEPVTGPTEGDLESIVMVSRDEGWAVGAGDAIFHYDQGMWWAVPNPTGRTLYDVFMINANEGWLSHSRRAHSTPCAACATRSLGFAPPRKRSLPCRATH